MKKLGFGCMRLPMLEENTVVDHDQFNQMVDTYMAAGFNYFDTAHGYIGGKSELALRECLTKRYPREAYRLTNKLTTNYFEKEDEIRPFFQNQLEWTGVEYFDYYLMHAMNDDTYKKYVQCNAFDVVKQLKDEGKIRHMGISFHDKAEVLDKILREQPDIEVVMIQFNYADYNDPGIESYKCYQVCEKYGKPVMIMEPVKGGCLVNLPEEAKKLIDDYGKEISYASYAVRFCASFEKVIMVLSGMSNREQVADNISYMKDFIPFSEEEFQLVDKIQAILKEQDSVLCTACQYCVEGCPKKIAIPDLFADYNAKKQFNDWNSDWYYSIHTKGKGSASDCIQCGKCEVICPQHLKIMELLVDVKAIFDK